MHKRIFAAVLCMVLFIMSPARAFAWYTEEPEDDGEAARGSFWDYEQSNPYSAYQSFIDDCEDTANYGFAMSELEEFFAFLNGYSDLNQNYEFPHEYMYLNFLDYTIRCLNETPISRHPGTVLATLAADLLDYYSVEINQPSAINEIFEAEFYRIMALNPFDDFPSSTRAEAARHEKLAQAYTFIDAFRIYNFLRNKTQEIKEDAQKYLDLMKIIWWLSPKLPIDIAVYKPNIYLYGDAGTRLTVSFTEKELLMKVLPEYEDSWTCVIEEDGSLTVDGQKGLPYLFYECRTSPVLMQTETGFIISPEERASQLEDMMTSYGFNEQETWDFVEYWDKHLDPEKTYYVFPQETITVDRAMPIEIDEGQVESYYRIWFYFLEEGTTEEPAPHTIHPVSHEGLSLIEWGVIL